MDLSADLLVRIPYLVVGNIIVLPGPAALGKGDLHAAESDLALAVGRFPDQVRLGYVADVEGKRSALLRILLIYEIL